MLRAHLLHNFIGNKCADMRGILLRRRSLISYCVRRRAYRQRAHTHCCEGARLLAALRIDIAFNDNGGVILLHERDEDMGLDAAGAASEPNHHAFGFVTLIDAQETTGHDQCRTTRATAYILGDSPGFDLLLLQGLDERFCEAVFDGFRDFTLGWLPV